MLHLIGYIILGLIAGAIAKAIMPGRDPGGLIVTILLGIVGSVIGGYIGRALFYNSANDAGGVTEPGFLMSLIFAVIGALILLAGYRLVRGRSLRA